MRSYYLAIEPPAQELGRLSLLMRRLGDSTPLPHVTVVPPPLLPPELTWLERVRDVAARTPPVSMNIGEARRFDDRVLYLAVDSPELGALRRRVLEAIDPTSMQDDFVAHLTLAVARHGKKLPTLEGLDPLLVSIDRFSAPALTLFRRTRTGERYHAWQRLAFEQS